jgi:threonine dehydrogenase-like Zn-dependent dehydrogenase
VLGHETSGYVAAVGSKVKHLSVGQPVVADYIVKCGSCLACRRGRPNLCRRPTYQQFSGGYGDYTVLPQQNIYPLRPETDMKAAAFMEPLACVVRGQDLLRLQPGEVELVVGLGPIGLMHMQVARAHGARVIAADLLPARLEKAKALGADWIVNSQETDLGAYVKDVTDGAPLDRVARIDGPVGDYQGQKVRRDITEADPRHFKKSLLVGRVLRVLRPKPPPVRLKGRSVLDCPPILFTVSNDRLQNVWVRF